MFIRECLMVFDCECFCVTVNVLFVGEQFWCRLENVGFCWKMVVYVGEW